MRIAMISPLYESVPPKLYGGTERVVHYLTEELVKAGHDVTLFASADSQTSARLAGGCGPALRLDETCRDPLAHHFMMFEKVLEMQGEFDVIHSNVDYIGMAFAKRTTMPFVTTVHGRLDLEDTVRVYTAYNGFPLVSISNSQRLPLPEANWAATIYHGLPENLYSLREKPGDYLAFIGRISPEKCVDSAIRIAVLAGIPLKIAAKVDKADQKYFEAIIKPLLAHPLVEFVGEVNDREKDELTGNALAFLHPVDWPEPFGLAMIEAMACGTPVLGRKRGSIPEVIDNGITGFIFERDEDAVKILRDAIPGLDRRRCRAHFEKRFSAARMAADYHRVYERVAGETAGVYRRKMHARS
ncbi:MAG: glycosyltransferase family 4 protein [Nitrospiraceae bacterium]|nr:glycosyltransferase family 4 protein [Nitrospiraceae bacterium]